MFEQPPITDNSLLQKVIPLMQREDVRPLITAANDEYWYWTDAKYKPCPNGIAPQELWAAIKLSRSAQRIGICEKYGITAFVTNRMQELCHRFDMDFGGRRILSPSVSSEDSVQYLISSLMEEAISSSQMEGASTTRKVAKDMLRKQASPRSRSEQMIFNNYASIRYIVEHKDEELTSEMLLHIHALMTCRTLESSEFVGRYRQNDEVVVENSITHEVVHTPPPHTDIPEFVDFLCHFANDEGKEFLHPILKAVAIHYMVAYVHPFADGNGRTARALFYWYMLKNGYWLTEYLSISRVIYKSKSGYEKSFLYCESDGGDMGYFIAYHLRVLELAVKEFRQYLERKAVQRKDGVLPMIAGGVNERQATILSWYRDNPNMVLTVKEVENRFGISQPTARLDVEGLVEGGYLAKVPVNKVKSHYVKGPQFDILLRHD